MIDLRNIGKRPIFYWPIVGCIAAIFTKGGATDPSAWVFWLGITISVGLLIEWQQTKKRILFAILLLTIVVSGYLFKGFLEAGRCLDSGDHWNDEAKSCERK